MTSSVENLAGPWRRPVQPASPSGSVDPYGPQHEPDNLIAMGIARRKQSKIFCIGFNKTGTTSIKTMLDGLGYRLGNQGRGEELLGAWYRRDFAPIAQYCKSAQAFQDVPFSLPFTFTFLDQRFPLSKFVLTERDNPAQWYDSLVRFHSQRWARGPGVPAVDDLRNASYRYRGFAYDYQKFVYNTPDDDLYNEAALTASYLRHNQHVRDYFRSRPDRLIVINVSRQPDFHRLCEFLEVTSSEQDFPWVNRTE